ncbi:MAG: ATP-binding cassette domain-containing protein [Clostridia bacterium]|nr:ATP-binding cassette domain-containing protein [Clostridia bacterium]
MIAIHNQYSEAERRLLLEEGIENGKGLYGRVVIDMNHEGKFVKGSILLTKDTLFVVEGESAEATVSRYAIKEIESLAVDELLSTCRFYAVVDGERQLLTYATFFAKDDLYRLSASFEKLKNEKENEIDTDFDSRFCPKCGRRYPDKERKFCPNCMEKGKVIKRMAGFFLRYRFYMIAIVASMLLLSAISVIAPLYGSKFLYDEVLDPTGAHHSMRGLVMIFLVIVFMRVLRVFVTMIHSFVTSIIAAKIVYDIKKVIFGAIERLSMSYFSSRTTGSLMNQIYHDANRIYWFFTDGLPYFTINILQLVVVTVMMLVFNPLLTLLALGLTPLVLFLIGKLFSKSRKLNHRRYIKSSSMNSLLSDLLTGIRVVKTFSREKSEAERFSRASRGLANAEMKRSKFGTTAYPLVHTVVYLGIIMVWGFGGWMVIKGFGVPPMTYGLLTLFLSYVGMVYDPLYSFVDQVEWGSDALNSMNRLFEIMDADTDVKESDNPVHFDEVQGDIVFDNVEFSYTKSRKIIDKVSFKVEAGKTLGIVGHTGSGKSTLANLLIRLYDVDEGSITVDGVNVKDIAFEDLRKSIAIVSQETYLFVGTIYDNIRYANNEATREEVIEAAKAAGAHDFIVKLPDAYDTMVGFGHKDLSGGEKQRVSIARALLRKPKILILDEATAAMDTQTERRIQNTLDSLSKGRTTIMIAHRLSTLKNADSLIVVNGGKVTEVGTHAELIAKKGEYYKLYKLQLDALKNVGVTE